MMTPLALVLQTFLMASTCPPRPDIDFHKATSEADRFKVADYLSCGLGVDVRLSKSLQQRAFTVKVVGLDEKMAPLVEARKTGAYKELLKSEWNFAGRMIGAIRTGDWGEQQRPKIVVGVPDTALLEKFNWEGSAMPSPIMVGLTLQETCNPEFEESYLPDLEPEFAKDTIVPDPKRNFTLGRDKTMVWSEVIHLTHCPLVVHLVVSRFNEYTPGEEVTPYMDAMWSEHARIEKWKAENASRIAALSASINERIEFGEISRESGRAEWVAGLAKFQSGYIDLLVNSQIDLE